MEKINYQKKLDRLIEGLQDDIPKVLLHSCCGPCSSYILEYLSEFFELTIFYYNPNIYPEEEYSRRLEEQKDIIDKIKGKNPIKLLEGKFIPKEFYETIKGYEHLGEGSERCFKCYRLRMEESAKLAKKLNMDYFTTTLSISPYKNAGKINEIGLDLEDKYGVKHLPSDFKKKGGYQRSIELSKEWNLYRQDYCGCVFSKREMELKKDDK